MPAWQAPQVAMMRGRETLDLASSTRRTSCPPWQLTHVAAVLSPRVDSPRKWTLCMYSSMKAGPRPLRTRPRWHEAQVLGMFSGDVIEATSALARISWVPWQSLQSTAGADGPAADGPWMLSPTAAAASPWQDEQETCLSF